jgi:hypothetical protein
MRDFLIADHGSIVSIMPITEAALKCIDEKVVCEPWQRLGGALCVDRRYARNLTNEIAAAGFDLAI